MRFEIISVFRMVLCARFAIIFYLFCVSMYISVFRLTCEEIYIKLMNGSGVITVVTGGCVVIGTIAKRMLRKVARSAPKGHLRNSK